MKSIKPILTALLAAILALLPAQVQAQDMVQVKGNVLDLNSLPIPGVTIMVKGKPALGGTITDDQGYFSFSFPPFS